MKTLTEHPVNRVGFSSDLKYCYTVHLDVQKVKVWSLDCDKGSSARLMSVRDAMDAAFTFDGRLLLSSLSNGLQVWNGTDEPVELAGCPPQRDMKKTDYSERGPVFRRVITSHDLIFSMETQLVKTFGDSYVTFDSPEYSLPPLSGARSVFWKRDSQIAGGWTQFGDYDDMLYNVVHIGLAADGESAAYVRLDDETDPYDRKLSIWYVKIDGGGPNPQQLPYLWSDRSNVAALHSVRVSRDGRVVAAADTTFVFFWQVERPDVPIMADLFEDEENYVESIEFSPASNEIAVASTDGEIAVLRIESDLKWTEILRQKVAQRDAYPVLSWSLDGLVLAIGMRAFFEVFPVASKKKRIPVGIDSKH